ncbi:hypothetical protein MASR2M18_16240 [Ignavibacteria bacterium]
MTPGELLYQAIFSKENLAKLLKKYNGNLWEAIQEIERIALDSDISVEYAMPKGIVKSGAAISCIRFVASWTLSHNNDLKEKLGTIRAMPSVDERYAAVRPMIEYCEEIAERFSAIKQKWHDENKEIADLWENVSVHDLTKGQKISLLQNLPGLLLYSGNAAVDRLSELNNMKNEIIRQKKYIQELYDLSKTDTDFSPVPEVIKMKQATAARIGLALMEKGELLYQWTKSEIAVLLTEHCRNEQSKPFTALYKAMKNDNVRIDLTGKEMITFNQVKQYLSPKIAPK